MGAGGVVGAVAADRLSKKGGASSVDLGGDLAYLAVMDSTVTLFKTKKSLVGLKPKMSDETLVEVPRADLARSAFSKGKIVSVFQLEFSDGSNWEFDVPRQFRKDGEKVAALLGSTIT
jgi:hypothetical protein